MTLTAHRPDYLPRGGTAVEWDNAPSPSVPLTMDPLQLPHDNGHQHWPTHTGGAHPKATVKPSATAWSQSRSQLRGMPDPVDHPNALIWTQRDRKGDHPQWWKEIRALCQSCVTSTLSKPEALYPSQWQAVAFRLPLAQDMASGWWEAPPCLTELHPLYFLSHDDSPGMRDFQTVRQVKTLALAWTLQQYAKRLGTPTGVLCNTAWELQRCMALLICLNKDEIVEASLLKPMDDGPRTSPTLVEKPPQPWWRKLPSWGRNWSCKRLMRLLHPPINVWRLPSMRNQLSDLTL